MSKSQDRSTPRVRRSDKRRSLKNHLRIEAVSRGARLLTLSFTSAFNIQGAGVTVNQVANDATGDAYIAGEYTGTATFGKDAGGNPITKNNTSGQPEPFVAEYSPAGVVLWYTQFVNQSGDTSSTSTAFGLAYDAPNGVVWVVGNFSGQVDFDQAGVGDIETSSKDSSTGADTSDAYIVGLNPSNGHESNQLFDGFVRTDSSTTTVTAFKVTTDPMDRAVDVTGSYFGGGISVSSGNTSIPLATPPANSEGFTAKFNKNLALQWAVNTSDASGNTLDEPARIPASR